MSETFDVVIIGAGPAGEIVGERAVKAGLTAVVVERDLVRRRMQLLGLYAKQGFAASRRGTPGGAASTRGTRGR